MIECKRGEIITSEKVLLQKIKVLPPDLKQKAIEFVDSLHSEAQKKTTRRFLKGALADLNIRITDEDIREARNGMWRGYTKDSESVC